MEQTKQFKLPSSKSLTVLEVEAIVEQKIEPIQTAVNPSSAPYLTVAHFLWFVGIMVTVGTTIFSVVWKRINTSSTRLHERIDETKVELEDTEDKIRSEFTSKNNRVDDRLWELSLLAPPEGKQVKIIDRTPIGGE